MKEAEHAPQQLLLLLGRPSVHSVMSHPFTRLTGDISLAFDALHYNLFSTECNYPHAGPRCVSICSVLSAAIVMQGRAKLQEVAHLKEAEQLLRSMLTFKPKGRPNMRAVMSHPFWWPHHQRLQFLIDMSDRMENEDREVRPLPHAIAVSHQAHLLLRVRSPRTLSLHISYPYK